MDSFDFKDWGRTGAGTGFGKSPGKPKAYMKVSKTKSGKRKSKVTPSK